MGLPKATLPFGPELMLQRVVRLLGSVVQPIVVVAAPKQELPPLPAGVLSPATSAERADRWKGCWPDCRPLRRSRRQPMPRAATCRCSPAFVQAMIDRLGDADIAVPVEGGLPHPLAAVYRTIRPAAHSRACSPTISFGRRFLFDRVQDTPHSRRRVRAADPQLATLRNLNRPEDYLAALREAGFEPDPSIVAAFETPRT